MGNNYFLNPAGGGTGPELHYGGSAVTAGEFGTWTPIGAVQVAGGYDVAWHDPSSGLYTVWSTDSNGNYLSNLTVRSPATAPRWRPSRPLQSGPQQRRHHRPPESRDPDGRDDALTEVGNNYFLNPTGGGTGPELHYGGSVVTAGEFGTWTPIGAVQVAWRLRHRLARPESGLYTMWSTDSNGNYLSNLIGAVAGNSSALESFETTFNQDLNNDGTIGIYVAPGTTLQVTNSASQRRGSCHNRGWRHARTRYRRFRVDHIQQLHRNAEARQSDCIHWRDR